MEVPFKGQTEGLKVTSIHRHTHIWGARQEPAEPRKKKRRTLIYKYIVYFQMRPEQKLRETFTAGGASGSRGEGERDSPLLPTDNTTPDSSRREFHSLPDSRGP